MIAAAFLLVAASASTGESDPARLFLARLLEGDSSAASKMVTSAFQDADNPLVKGKGQLTGAELLSSLSGCKLTGFDSLLTFDDQSDFRVTWHCKDRPVIARVRNFLNNLDISELRVGLYGAPAVPSGAK